MLTHVHQQRSVVALEHLHRVLDRVPTVDLRDVLPSEVHVHLHRVRVVFGHRVRHRALQIAQKADVDPQSRHCKQVQDVSLNLE